MSGPPENVTPSDLWLALSAIPRPYKLVDLPRNLPGTSTPVGQVAIWPLSQEEQMAVNAEADRFTKKLLRDPQKKDEANLGYEHTYANEVAIQVLWRVCRDASDIDGGSHKRPAFPSPKLMRETFTADEVGVLFNEYLTVQSELGPIVAGMSDDELEAWVRRIAKGGSAYPFDSLSWEQQRTLVLFMACRLDSYWTAMSSAGSQPDEPPKSGSGPTQEGAEEAAPEPPSADHE